MDHGRLQRAAASRVAPVWDCARQKRPMLHEVVETTVISMLRTRLRIQELAAEPVLHEQLRQVVRHHEDRRRRPAFAALILTRAAHEQGVMLAGSLLCAGCQTRGCDWRIAAMYLAVASRCSISMVDRCLLVDR